MVISTSITGRLYKIPLIERYMMVGQGMGYKEKCLHIDKVGLYVRYDKEEEIFDGQNNLKLDFIRRHLVFVRNTYCLVEANNIKDAIKSFHEEWEGARVGDKRVKSKALRINLEKEIMEFPYCEWMRKSTWFDNNEAYSEIFTCGDVEDENFVSDCIADSGGDVCEGCPAVGFYGKAAGHLREVRVFNGYKYVSFRAL